MRNKGLCFIFILSVFLVNSCKKDGLIREHIDIPQEVTIKNCKFYKYRYSDVNLYPYQVYMFFETNAEGYAMITMNMYTKDQIDKDSLLKENYNWYYKGQLWNFESHFTLVSGIRPSLPWWWNITECDELKVGFIDEKTNKIANFKSNVVYNGRVLSCFHQNKCFFFVDYTFPPYDN